MQFQTFLTSSIKSPNIPSSYIACTHSSYIALNTNNHSSPQAKWARPLTSLPQTQGSADNHSSFPSIHLHNQPSQGHTAPVWIIVHMFGHCTQHNLFVSPSSAQDRRSQKLLYNKTFIPALLSLQRWAPKRRLFELSLP